MNKVKKVKFFKGFSLVEILTIIVIISILSTIIFIVLKDGRVRARNANIVRTMSNLESVVDLEKYPGSLANLCNDFEPGQPLGYIRTAVEDMGGIWNCDSTVTDFRIFAKLHTPSNLAFGNMIQRAFAQTTVSSLHSFGNYYCVNSKVEKNFTHWSGNNLTYPSCNDADYISTPVDPEPTPTPTPDPNPTPVPPPVPSGSCPSGKQAVCHFGNTLCISTNAVQAHQKHGDIVGVCP
jgi:hypothetical protein